VPTLRNIQEDAEKTILIKILNSETNVFDEHLIGNNLKVYT